MGKMLNLIYTLIMAGTIYATGGRVVDVVDGGRSRDDVVTIETAAGLYQTHADDLQIGDGVALMMYDVNGTPNDVTDDVIISVKYVSGF